MNDFPPGKLTEGWIDFGPFSTLTLLPNSENRDERGKRSDKIKKRRLNDRGEA